jgi:GT2 family glycosyltransferase
MPVRSIVAVVLNWCAQEDSTRAVTSLLNQGEPGLSVLLVDNASPDGSGARLAAQFPTVTYLQTGANLGYAGGNQRAIAWALEQGADAILLMNDDAALQPRCLRTLREALDANPQLGGCAPTVTYAPPHDDRIWWAGGQLIWHRASATHWRMGQRVAPPTPAPHAVTSLSGCVVLLRSAALRDVGGLNPAYFSYVEDVDLSARLVAGGWALAWVPSAVAHHHCPYPQPHPSPWAITQRDRNRRLFAQLQLRGAHRLAFAAWYYPSRLLLAARYLAAGDRARSVAVWRGMTAPLPSPLP